MEKMENLTKGILVVSLWAILVFIVLWGSLLVLSADAQERPPREMGPKAFINRLDVDSDGLVSMEEFDGPGDFFDRLDEDGDGFLDESEAPKGPPKLNFAEMDQDGDDLISAEEFMGLEDAFFRFDGNEDGYLEQSELPKGPPPARDKNESFDFSER